MHSARPPAHDSEGVCPGTCPSSSRLPSRFSQSIRSLPSRRPRDVRTSPLAVHASTMSGRIQGVVRDDVGPRRQRRQRSRDGNDAGVREKRQPGPFRAVAAGWRLHPASHARGVRLDVSRSRSACTRAAQLERNITLLRQGVRTAERSIMTASLARTVPVEPEQIVPASSTDHSHTEAAWRLRHLPRSILRDGMSPIDPAPGGQFVPGRRPLDQSFGRIGARSDVVLRRHRFPRPGEFPDDQRR